MGLRQTIESILATYKENETVNIKMQNGIDDLTFVFKKSQTEKISLSCSLMSFPTHVWYCDDENEAPEEIMNFLTEHQNGNLEEVIQELVIMLCKSSNIPIPTKLLPNRPGSSIELMELGEPLNHSNENDDFSQNDDDSDVEIQLDPSSIEPIGVAKIYTKKSETPNLANEKLDKIRNRMKKSSSSSSAATIRLMKDAQETLTSKSVKDGFFSVEIDESNIYTWTVKILKVDEDSELAKDMKKVPNTYIELQLKFSHDYPFSPPKVRVVRPVIEGGYVHRGGAICMELLTKKGWCSAYTIETIVLQVATTITKGNGRIGFNKNPDTLYSESAAERTFVKMEKLHDTGGWSRRQNLNG